MKRNQNPKLAGQLDLFECAPDTYREAAPFVTRTIPVPLPEPASETREPTHCKAQPRKLGRRAAAPKPSVVVLESDLPRYDADEIALVDATIAEMPPSKLWFTYQDIQRLFGVSRATVARKVKAGLVPGIRFADGRVVEEGAVRRFSRTQIRFVLLAVRRRDAATAAS